MSGGATGAVLTAPAAAHMDEKSGMGDDKGTLDSSSIVSSESEIPTEEELRTLRKVSDKLPWSAFIVALVELCERFAFYGLSGPFQNYIQNPYGDPKVPGALGKLRAHLGSLRKVSDSTARSRSDGRHRSGQLLPILVLRHTHPRRNCSRSVSGEVQYDSILLHRLHHRAYHPLCDISPGCDRAWCCSRRSHCRHDHHRSGHRRDQIKRQPPYS